MCEIYGTWCIAVLYSSNLKVVAVYSSNISVNFYGNKGIISQKMVFMKHTDN